MYWHSLTMYIHTLTKVCVDLRKYFVTLHPKVESISPRSKARARSLTDWNTDTIDGRWRTHNVYYKPQKLRPTRTRDIKMETRDLNRLVYLVEKQSHEDTIQVLESLKEEFQNKATAYDRLTQSDEAWNIYFLLSGPRFTKLDNLRQRLHLKSTECWKASGIILDRIMQEEHSWTQRRKELGV